MNKKLMTAALSVLAALAPAIQAQSLILPHPLPMPIPVIVLQNTNETPVTIREWSVEATVEDLYARVTTTIGFYNPNPRVLEGELSFPLPDGATVCGYALDINGAMVDAVAVEKEAARVAFESEVRRGVDPGLVEHVRGNVFSTRVYPLPAEGMRTVRVSYVHALPCAADGSTVLALPMPRTPLAKRDITIEVARADDAPAPVLGGLSSAQFGEAQQFWRVESHATDVEPDDDLSVTLPALPETSAFLQRDADGALWASISAVAPHSTTPYLHQSIAELTRPLAIYWDASASHAEANLDAELEFLGHMPRNTCTPVIVRLFRNDGFEPPQTYETPIDAAKALRKVDYDGGTALSRLAPHPDDLAAHARILLFTDGLDTLAGPDARPDFSAVLGEPDGIVAVVSSTQADRELLRQVTGGALIDLQTCTSREAMAQLLNPPVRAVAVEGAEFADLQGLAVPATGRVRLLGRLHVGVTDKPVLSNPIRIAFSDGTFSAPIPVSLVTARTGDLLPLAWAAARVAELSAAPSAHHAELLALGRRHTLVTPATSLLVLDTLDQWVRYRIEPPESLPELRQRYRDALKRQPQPDPEADRRRHLDALAKLWGDRVSWWLNPEKPASSVGRGRPLHADDPDYEPEAEYAYATDGMPAPAAARLAPFVARGNVPRRESAEFRANAMVLDEAGVVGGMVAEEMDLAVHAMSSAKASSSAPSAAPVITITPWDPKAPYLKNLRARKTAKARYNAYLKERAKPENASSPAFFLDCATVLFKAGDTAAAVRVLSNLAELKLDSPPLLRVLAWRLQQAGALDDAIAQLRRIALLRPEEPQSFRDLATALVQRGTPEDLAEAADLLVKVATTPWNRHADTIPLFALEEHNALRALHADALPAESSLPPDLATNLDLDLRIVLTWDADATDIDLHVIDPTGEEAYYGHNRTTAGGLVSRDITDGYGPEEFLLRHAPAGEYHIYAKYYGSHQQTLTGPVTVTATVYTDWGRPAQQRQLLTLRLDKQKDYLEVGRITIDGPAK